MWLLVILPVIALVALAAKGSFAPRTRPGAKASASSPSAEERAAKSEALDISRFQEYADIYEKRYLAYLIEETAERLGADMAAIDRLRAEYGKEVLAPPYEAQGCLHAKGVALTDILHMQTEWIRRNGGNPEARPAAREVERIVKSRNIEKAKKIWEQNHA